MAIATIVATLVVTVWPSGPGGPSTRHVVHCPRTPGCARLTRADFAPVPAGVACSQVYGGPQRALVTGTLDGRRVYARFRRTDGCQTERWQRVAFLFRT